LKSGKNIDPKNIEFQTARSWWVSNRRWHPFPIRTYPARAPRFFRLPTGFPAKLAVPLTVDS
jgi:hypothetical protein